MGPSSGLTAVEIPLAFCISLRRPLVLYGVWRDSLNPAEINLNSGGTASRFNTECFFMNHYLFYRNRTKTYIPDNTDICKQANFGTLLLCLRDIVFKPEKGLFSVKSLLIITNSWIFRVQCFLCLDKITVSGYQRQKYQVVNLTELVDKMSGTIRDVTT